MATKYGVKEVCDITFYDLTTGKPLLYLDTLKMSTIENTAESSDARGGKGNPKLLTWDYNRDATVQMQDALMSMKSISLMTGNELKTGTALVTKRELLTAVAGTVGETKVTLENTPAGKVTIQLFSTDQEVEGLVEAKEITFDEIDVAIGTQVAVFYTYTTVGDAEVITISASRFPGYVKVVGDTVIRNATTGLDEAFQVVIHKAKVQPNFNLTFQADGDPTAFDMNLNVYKRDQDDEMLQLIKY